MLTEITEKDGFLIDLKYASKDNFTREIVYKKPKCYLHSEAFEKLKLAQKFAEKLGFKIKIFDAFRPAEAQYILWNHTPDPNFLAHPERGSAHSRGVAVDLTLLDKNNNELDMGTAFDAFTPLSYLTENENISTEAIKNRMILLGIMSASGWDFYKNEWWHFQLFDAKKYPLIWDKDAKTDMM
ncbi:MAG: D-alanyl-D-alanine dipeptidase [Rickettsiales bacterium]|nr:D-alanyl-D-alanine dipeptidase [Rickettsiales bacterium]